MQTTRSSTDLKFRKSSHSAGASECVEVADLPTGAAVRDSKHVAEGHFVIPSREWTVFLDAVRDGGL
ncbi:DUF397 domain-containing protein [Nocardiopsis sp. RSe5-2]|uniref:DUF397 domain-containing protein n=1 Tax=Nocardiopsis endophytica TaxID=3018445 RepID=A0ABT4U3V1_9ACTN|nr:DUF397 domain-containing protein [Nocardiopsis endophytica]MDA2811638.1 DUF397 domain-containing protein [Nocardiopsis endophytica]